MTWLGTVLVCTILASQMLAEDTPVKSVHTQSKKYQVVYGQETENLKARAPVLVLGASPGSFGFSTLSMQIDLVLNMNKYPSWHARWTPEAEIWLKYRGEQLRVVDRLTVDDVQRDGTQIRVSCRRTISTDKERSDAPYLPVACVVLGKLPPGKYEVQWIVKTYRPGDEEHPNASAGATPASEKPEILQHSFTVEPAVEKTSAAGILLDRICKAFPIGEHIPPDRFSAHPDLPALARIAETDIDSLLAEGFGKSMIVINPQRFEQFKKTTRMSLRLPQDGSKAKDVPTRADYEKYMASWREQEVRRGEVDRRREIIWMIVKKVASTRRQVLVDLLDHKDLSIRWSTTQFLLSSPSLKDDKVVAALQALARDKPPAGTNASEMSREYFRRHETAVLAALVLSNWQVKEDMNDTPDATAVGGTPPAGQQPTISGLVDRRFASISRSIKADFDNAVSPNNTINTDKRSSGQVWAWGDLQTSKGPAAKGLIREIQDVVAVSAGAGTLYALTKSGDVWAWGQGPWRVGAGTEEDQPTPIRVKGLSEVTAISAGFGHCLAMKRDGTVWAWGHNEHGQLGDGSKENRNVPVQVKGLKDVMAVSAGKDHSCTLRSDGTIWVWGDNAFGQCGESTDVEHYLTPVQMAGLSDVVAVSNGYTHNLALRKDGTVWQWGVHARKPSRVPQLDRVKAIAAGAWFALALKEDGTLWAWGKFEQAWQNVDVASVVPSHRREKRGELSLPEIAQQYVPHQVMDWHDVTLITAECRAVVARKDGSVWQWGRDCPLRRVGEIRSPLALSTGWNMSLALTRNAPPENPAHNESTSSKKDLLSALTPTDDSYFRIRKNFHRLKIGMTKPEVAQVIGYPRFNRDSDRWNCEFMDTGMADKETYVVEFKNGTVIKKYGIGKHYARPREWE